MITKSKDPKNYGETKAEFAANVTHELKTPLTSIIGFIELLKKSGEKSKETREYFYDVIDSEAQRLLHLIDDILLLSQVENGQNNILTQKCNIKKELDVVLKTLIPIAKNKNIKIVSNIENDLMVNASSSRLQQLFSNLISNAIKYNTDNGSIFINACAKDSNIIIKIKDTGIGIDSNHINKIFDRFYRVNSSETNEIPGNGLGLSIVKDIVTLYNGSVSVNSKVGEGSEFVISFPDASN